MKYSTSILTISVLAASMAITLANEAPKFGPPSSNLSNFQPPIYNMSLDVNATERWRKPITDFKAQLHASLQSYEDEIGLAFLRTTPLSWIKSYDAAMAEEIAAVAELADMSPGDVFWINMMYELKTYCTSIVYEDKKGNIIHGRNLDYDFKNISDKIMFQGNFYKNGSLIYKAQLFAGGVGFVTGERVGNFSLSIDKREDRQLQLVDSTKGHLDGLKKNLVEILINKRMGVQWTMRMALENNLDFESTLSFIINRQLAAPAYFILSGTQHNQGAVISMGRDQVFAVDTLDSDADRWFLVQTNYDRDLPDPSNDDRRTVAEKLMKEIGRKGMTEEKLFNEVLSTYPVLNNETIVSIVFPPYSGEFNVTAWSTSNYSNSSNNTSTAGAVKATVDSNSFSLDYLWQKMTASKEETQNEKKFLAWF